MKNFLIDLGKITLASIGGFFLSLIFIALVFWLTGCATFSNKKTSREEELEKQIKKLTYRTDYVEYEATNKFCFVELDICHLKELSSCQDNLVCAKRVKNACWIVHEKCIIENHRRWKELEKNH